MSWTDYKKNKLLFDILSGRLSLHAASTTYNLPRNQLISWLNNYTHGHTVNSANHVLEWKDLDSRFQGRNDFAAQLGSNPIPGDARGLTDFDLTPEKAAEYVALDQAVINNKQPISATEDVYVPDLGMVSATADILPIYNSHNDVMGVLIIGRLNLSLANQNFIDIMNTLNKGYGYLFFTETSYPIKHQNRNIELSPRELECILYLTIGKTSKQISIFMRASVKTIDNLIARLKDKLNCYSTSEITSILLENKVLSNL